MAEPMQEASTGEHQSLFPADPECSSVGAQRIASRLCLCTQKTQIFVSASEEGKYVCMSICKLQNCKPYNLVNATKFI